MKSQLFFSSSPLLSLVCFILVIHANIQSSLSNPEACKNPFRCGDINAGYPFWGVHFRPESNKLSRPSYCGHRDFGLFCDEKEATTIRINEVKYNVLGIDETAHTLKIARDDYYTKGLCTFPYPFLNTTIDSELFEYSPAYENVTLLYGCPPSPNQSGHFSCRIKDVEHENGYIQVGSIGPGECSASITVPVPKDLLPAAKDNPSALLVALKKGFELTWKIGGMLCEDCTHSKGICGSDLVSNETICFCSHTAPPLHGPCPTSPAKPDQAPKGTPSSSGPGLFLNRRWKISLAIAAAAVGTLIIFSIILASVPRRDYILGKAGVFLKKKTENDRNVEAFVRNFGSLAPKQYSYYDVKRMTKSFGNRLGHGGYGDVYRGKLPDGRIVAVKLLKESKGNGEEFINEVASISRTSHVNIVTLLGFCYEREKRALIYEFMPNGSLDNFIFDQVSSSTNLEWKTMYQIAVGIARGLEYLHRGCNTRIVHFDIKPQNILLDEDFCPKISDFGLAKLCKKKESIISMLGARGTIGYIAPEVFIRSFGEVSHKSDVYSYGMMILEMVGGRKNVDVEVSHTSEIYFPNWIYKQLEPGKDFEFHGADTQEGKELAKKMVLVSLWCIQTIPSDRPSMTRVVEMLEGGLEYLQVPPNPSLSSQTRSPLHFFPISSSSSSA